jgi:hypothetical protein
MNPPDPKELERLVHAALRALPDRRAPHTLENRVRAAIAARASRPWWQQSFLQWPLAMRGAFLVLSAAGVKLAVVAAVFVLGNPETAHVTQAFANQFAWAENILGFFSGMAEIGSAVFRALPPLWLYGGIAVLASLYATLFGLGAAAYRTLYVER